VEFGVLGPVEVRIAGRAVDAGHARQRAVLAVLLLDLGRAVTPELLIDRVWGHDPPMSVRNVLYGYVARLRAVLADPAGTAVTLARGQGGYLLQVRSEQLDLCRFRRQVGAAAEVADDEHAEALLRAALTLWRGPALAGLESPWLHGMRDTLEAERSAAAMDLTDIRLRRGEHRALASELTWQVEASPTDERLIGQLMLALYRSGRQAEALRWFARTRERLADEFGADPGHSLQTLHQRMLQADPALDAADPGGAGQRTRVHATCRRPRRARPSARLACRGRRP
jgi:DNA-binding SARP family transcriptional activator